jgi:membrane-bound metal-dependent hydrolase YbcI (DUF457 family)
MRQARSTDIIIMPVLIMSAFVAFITAWALGASVVFSVILSVILTALLGVLMRRRFAHIGPVPETNVRKVLPVTVGSAIAFSAVFLVVALLIHHAH